jgi:tetratricopeptide (TPR) repeat protein
VAEQLLRRINPGTPVYLYAQYTLAVVNIETEKVPAAIQNLQNIVSDTTLEASEQMLQDAANLKLGHIYFEQGDQLRQAVEHYRRVAVGSAYGDEALLATAWAWIKVNQPDQCRQDAERLLLSYPQSPLVPEAYLVKGYAHMLIKQYRDAVSSLEKSLQLVKGEFATKEELEKRRRVLDRVTSDFVPTAQEIKKNAMRKPTDRLLEERSTLKAEYDKYYQQNNEFFQYVVLAKSHSRFFMRKEQIIEDAEYALAKATGMMKTAKQYEAIGETKKETEKIDEKLDELKKQLEDMNK